MWKNQVFVIGIIVSLSPNIFAEPPLVGRWIEDESLRTGLYDFLWARGKFEKKTTIKYVYIVNLVVTQNKNDFRTLQRL